MASAALGPSLSEDDMATPPSESKLHASACSSTTGPKEEQQTDNLRLGLPQYASDTLKAVVLQEASSSNTQLAGISDEPALHARIEALNKEHELLLSTAVKQDEDIASAHRALQARSEQAVELAQEVAAATARLHEATAREHRQEAELMQERSTWADQQQQSAAEAQAATDQIGQLQGLLKDAHRQLSLAKEVAEQSTSKPTANLCSTQGGAGCAHSHPWMYADRPCWGQDVRLTAAVHRLEHESETCACERRAMQEQIAAMSAKVGGAEHVNAALQKLQDELHRHQAGQEEACRLARQSEVHAELDRALLRRAQAERDRDSHLVLALQQLLGAAAAHKGHSTERHKHCRSCRRRMPA